LIFQHQASEPNYALATEHKQGESIIPLQLDTDAKYAAGNTNTVAAVPYGLLAPENDTQNLSSDGLVESFTDIQQTMGLETHSNEVNSVDHFAYVASRDTIESRVASKTTHQSV
jgi:hypothetical protein